MNQAEQLANSSHFLIPSSRLQLPLKLNIHFEVEPHLLHYCVEANRIVGSNMSSEIDFAPPSIQKPHLTLAMGYCETETAYAELLILVQNIASELPAIQIKIGAPYFKGPKHNYLFIDIEPQDRIIELKRSIESRLGGLLSPLSWDVAGEPPHITLAYVRGDRQRAEESLSALPLLSSSSFTAISISASGPRGSCLGVMRRYELQRSEQGGGGQPATRSESKFSHDYNA